MTTPLNFARDINGYNTFGPFFSQDNAQIDLVADTEKTTTVPNEASTYLAIFSFESGSKVWVACNNTATLPTGDFTSTLSQLNPQARWVNSGDVLHFITNDSTAEVGVSYYAL